MANSGLGVAVVGVGRWGRNLVRVFADLRRAQLVAACDVSPTSLRRHVPERAKRTTDYAEILADPAVDAVALATPAATHDQLAVQAFEAGKHVFVEKPLALSVPAAERVAQASTDAGRRLMIGHILQYHPAVTHLKGLLDRGRLGEVRYALCDRLGPGTTRDVDSWWALAPHDVSVLRYLLGETPTEVVAHGHDAAGLPGPAVVSARLRFGSGLTAFVHVSSVHPTKTRRLTLVGTELTATFDDLGPNKLVVGPTPPELRELDRAPDPLPVTGRSVCETGLGEPLRLEAQHFVDGVLDGAPIRSGAEDGVTAVRVLEAGSRSVRLGGTPVAV